jgi:hypothetical protein
MLLAQHRMILDLQQRLKKLEATHDTDDNDHRVAV